MDKNGVSIIKGIGTGLVAGMTIALIGSNLTKNSNKMKRKTAKVADKTGEMINSVQDFFK